MDRRRARLALIAALSTGAVAAASLVRQAPADAVARANPYANDERAVRAGRKLYLRECAACHGKAGEGIGMRPALVSKEVTDAAPGSIEWVIRNGSSRGMPSFAHLPEPRRWQIVTYLQSAAFQAPAPSLPGPSDGHLPPAHDGGAAALVRSLRHGLQ